MGSGNRGTEEPTSSNEFCLPQRNLDLDPAINKAADGELLLQSNLL